MKGNLSKYEVLPTTLYGKIKQALSNHDGGGPTAERFTHEKHLAFIEIRFVEIMAGEHGYKDLPDGLIYNQLAAWDTILLSGIHDQYSHDYLRFRNFVLQCAAKLNDELGYEVELRVYLNGK